MIRKNGRSQIMGVRDSAPTSDWRSSRSTSELGIQKSSYRVVKKSGFKVREQKRLIIRPIFNCHSKTNHEDHSVGDETECNSTSLTWISLMSDLGRRCVELGSLPNP